MTKTKSVQPEAIDRGGRMPRRPGERYGQPVPGTRNTGNGRKFVLAALLVACLIAGGLYYFLRGGGGSSPVNAVTATNITSNSAVITWTTPQPSASQVEYGATSAYGLLSVFNAAPVTSHSITLTALNPGTTYNYAALSTAANGDVTTSSGYTFITPDANARGGAAPTPAGAPSVSPPTVTGVTTNSATIVWETDQPSAAQVEYGPSPAYGSLSAYNSSLSMTHSVKLTALVPGATYNFAAHSTNAAGQIGSSANSTFTTASVAGVPVISNVKTAGVTANSATITWTTDQPSASQVQFGPTPGYGSLSAFSAPLVNSHSVTIPGLTAGKAYNYAALSVNATGQVGTSTNFILTTASQSGPAAVNAVTSADITTNSVTIVWTTDQPSASQVEYGTTASYGLLSGFGSAPATSHKVHLTALTPGTTYNYAALSTGAGGQVSKSGNFTFTTLSGPPVIRQLKVARVTGTSATITWTTDQPSTSVVEFGATSGLRALLRRHTVHNSRSPAAPALVTFHSVTLTGLSPDTTYEYAAQSANSVGLQNLSPSMRFSTSASKSEIIGPKQGLLGMSLPSATSAPRPLL
jgi:hypothetical protein